MTFAAWPCVKGFLRIGQLAEGASDAWQVRFAYLHDRRRFGVEDLHTRIATRCLRDYCRAGGCEVLYDRRVERLPRAVLQRVDDIANSETEQLGGLGRHACDARGSSDLFAAQRTSSGAVPPLMNVVQTVADAVRQSDATRDASRNLATRLIVSLAEGTARHCHAHSSRTRATGERPRVAPGISFAKMSRMSVRSVSTAARLTAWSSPNSSNVSWA